MSDTEKKQSPKKASASTEPNPELQAAFDEANDHGYFGHVTDPTPNANYTVAGVIAGKPTPETDAKSAAKAREARHQ